MSSLVSRKKGSKQAETILEETPVQTPEDPEESVDPEEMTDPEEDSPSSTTTHIARISRVVSRVINRFTSDPSSRIGHVINRIKVITLVEVNMCLLCLVVVMTLMLVLAPAHIRKKRDIVIAQQIQDVSNSITAQRAALDRSYKYLHKTINGENERLVDDLYEMVGLVSKLRHEEEVAKRDSSLKSLESSTKDKINAKQAEIDSLNADLAKHKAELDKVKGKMENLVVKPENFCDGCVIAKMGISCGKRKGYFTGHYKTSEQDALNAVVKQSPECFKK